MVATLCARKSRLILISDLSCVQTKWQRKWRSQRRPWHSVRRIIRIAIRSRQHLVDKNLFLKSQMLANRRTGLFLVDARTIEFWFCEFVFCLYVLSSELPCFPMWTDARMCERRDGHETPGSFDLAFSLVLAVSTSMRLYITRPRPSCHGVSFKKIHGSTPINFTALLMF